MNNFRSYLLVKVAISIAFLCLGISPCAKGQGFLNPNGYDNGTDLNYLTAMFQQYYGVVTQDEYGQSIVRTSESQMVQVIAGWNPNAGSGYENSFYSSAWMNLANQNPQVFEAVPPDDLYQSSYYASLPPVWYYGTTAISEQKQLRLDSEGLASDSPVLLSGSYVSSFQELDAIRREVFSCFQMLCFIFGGMLAFAILLPWMWFFKK